MLWTTKVKKLSVIHGRRGPAKFKSKLRNSWVQGIVSISIGLGQALEGNLEERLVNFTKRDVPNRAKFTKRDVSNRASRLAYNSLAILDHS